MKYYIINADGKEVSFDLSATTSDQFTTGFKVSNNVGLDKSYFVKSIAGKNFISKDKIRWNKLPKISSQSPLVSVTETLNVYKGFKPSGLNSASAGELISQMPGKVIKVMTTEGAVVNVGDTLIILEAMKMENEIKAGVNGVVKSVQVEEGQVLESGHLMIEIEE